MDIQLLRENLNSKHNILCFETIDSTNTYTKKNHKTLPSQSIIIAKTQTTGRGKNNRTWFSPTGGIYMSFLLKELSVHNEILPLITSLAIVNTLNSHNIPSQIKWPNDIIVKNKKLGGILVEAKISSSSKSYIIGIGLNTRSLLPSIDLKDKFISLNEVNTNIPDNEVLIAQICNEILSLLEKSSTYIIQEYKKKSILLGKKVFLNNELTERFLVNVIDVNNDGSLKVEKIESSKILNIISGEFSITGQDKYI